MALRLGFHYHVPALAVDGGIHMPGFQGRFVDSLAAHCDQVMCFLHTPLPSERSILDYRITAPNVTLVNFGPHLSVPKRTIFASHFCRPVRERRQDLDAMLIRGPSPLLAHVARSAAGVPLILLVVGDYLAGVDDLPQPRWRKEAIRLWARWNQWHQRRTARRSLTFVNSRKLFEHLRPWAAELIETRTTTLKADDFFERDDTFGGPPYRLLYTGRMSKEKGLMDLVEAMALLVAQGKDVVLDLVGWPAKNDPILEELQALARKNGIAGRLVYHGYKPVGPELFAYYQKADVYVLASNSSFEGFPRAIWEAMAHCLPVVATKVGSIPFFLQDEEHAVLVSPRRPKELAGAINRLLEEPLLRRKLIARAVGLARENTLESRTQKMVSDIESWLARVQAR